jgi:hypothetical protein
MLFTIGMVLCCLILFSADSLPKLILVGGVCYLLKSSNTPILNIYTIEFIN